MRSKLFRILSIMMILSMIAIPVSAKPINPDPGVDLQPAEAYPVYNTSGRLDQRGVVNEEKGATGIARYIIQLQAPAAASYTGWDQGPGCHDPQNDGRRQVQCQQPRRSGLP